MTRDDGFTLAETLVAMALLALIAAYATSTLRVLSNVQRVEREMDAKASEQAAIRSMSVSLAGMRPVKTADSSGNQVIDFRGTGREISFIAPLDDRLERGGLYRMRYGVDPASRRLVMRYSLRRGADETGPEGGVAMLDDVTDFALRYSADGLNWTEEWTSTDKIPPLIEVRLGSIRKLVAVHTVQ